MSSVKNKEPSSMVDTNSNILSPIYNLLVALSVVLICFAALRNSLTWLVDFNSSSLNIQDISFERENKK